MWGGRRACATWATSTAGNHLGRLRPGCKTRRSRTTSPPPPNTRHGIPTRAAGTPGTTTTAHAPAADDAAAVVAGRPRDARPRLPRRRRACRPHRQLRRPVRHKLRQYGNNLGASVHGSQLVRAAVDAADGYGDARACGRPRRRGRPADGRQARTAGSATGFGRCAGRRPVCRAPRRFQRRSRLAAADPSSRAAEEEGEEGLFGRRRRRRSRSRGTTPLVAFDVARCTGSARGAPARPPQPLFSPLSLYPRHQTTQSSAGDPWRARRARPPLLTRAPPRPSQALLPAATRRRHRCRRRARRVGVGGARDRLRPGLLFQYADERDGVGPPPELQQCWIGRTFIIKQTTVTLNVNVSKARHARLRAPPPARAGRALQGAEHRSGKWSVSIDVPMISRCSGRASAARVRGTRPRCGSSRACAAAARIGAPPPPRPLPLGRQLSQPEHPPGG